MRVLVLNGPNLNLLGMRENELYGSKSYADLKRYIKSEAKKIGICVKILQFNSESKLVTAIQRARGKYAAIVLNAAAYTHTSVAILDALKAVRLPTVEVHLTDIQEREDFRKFSFVSLYAEKLVKGKGFEGYSEALNYLKDTYCK